MTNASSRAVHLSRLTRDSFIVAASAVFTNVLVWATADAVLEPLQVPGDGEPVALTWSAVVAATVAGIALATGLAVLLRRLAPAPRRAFLVVVVVGTLGSLGGPLTAEVEAGSRAALAAMHVVTGSAAAALARRLPARSRQITTSPSPTQAKEHP